jgi:membrane-associated protease RseP (regulator of RpoE activity)
MNRNRKFFGAVAWGLVLGLTAWTGVARADDGDENGPGKKVVRKHIVIVDKDGKERVYDGDGPMMRRGYLGVGLTELTPELRAHFGVPGDSGTMVSRVEPGSPADKAGIKVGDILTRIDGNGVESSWDVSAKVRGFDDGQQIPIEVWRNGKAQNVTATIVQKERPELDLGPMFFKEGKDLERFKIRMDPEELKGMKERMRVEGVDGKDVQIRHRLVSPREADLEKQLKELEKRIAELEKQIRKQ